MSGVELVMAAASAASVAGQVVQGFSAMQSAQVQAQVTENEGQFALSRAAQESENIAIEGERAIGEARANAGAYGFDLTGSASDIFGRIAAERMAAARGAAFDGDLAYKNAQFEAAQVRKAGKQQFTASMLGAVAEGVSGAVAVQQEMKARKGSNARTLPRAGNTSRDSGRKLNAYSGMFSKNSMGRTFGLFDRRH